MPGLATSCTTLTAMGTACASKTRLATPTPPVNPSHPHKWHTKKATQCATCSTQPLGSIAHAGTVLCASQKGPKPAPTPQQSCPSCGITSWPTSVPANTAAAIEGALHTKLSHRSSAAGPPRGSSSKCCKARAGTPYRSHRHSDIKRISRKIESCDIQCTQQHMQHPYLFPVHCECECHMRCCRWHGTRFIDTRAQPWTHTHNTLLLLSKR